jgi:hypothetical protein
MTGMIASCLDSFAAEAQRSQRDRKFNEFPGTSAVQSFI